jgi:hypothetical protein
MNHKDAPTAEELRKLSAGITAVLAVRAGAATIRVTGGNRKCDLKEGLNSSLFYFLVFLPFIIGIIVI